MRRSILALLTTSFLVACSSSSTTDPASDAALSSDDAAADVASEAADDAAAEAAPAEPKAPVLKSLAKMTGVLHVNWTNVEPDCDGVEAERKSDTDPYAVVFTVPGTVNNKMDNTASADTTYTYRLRCKKAGVYSPYSNELSANPTK